MSLKTLAFELYMLTPCVDESLRLLAQRILAVCADFIEISKFIDTRMQFEHGLVNHALCDGLNSLLKDYLVLAAQLETLHNQSKLTLQVRIHIINKCDQRLNKFSTLILNYRDTKIQEINLFSFFRNFGSTCNLPCACCSC